MRSFWITLKSHFHQFYCARTFFAEHRKQDFNIIHFVFNSKFDQLICIFVFPQINSKRSCWCWTGTAYMSVEEQQSPTQASSAHSTIRRSGKKFISEHKSSLIFYAFTSEHQMDRDICELLVFCLMTLIAFHNCNVCVSLIPDHTRHKSGPLVSLNSSTEQLEMQPYSLEWA